MSGLTLGQVHDIRSKTGTCADTGIMMKPDALRELCDLALKAMEAPDSRPEPIHNPPLHLLVGKIPDFDQNWTPEQKLSWFDGMAKLLQAAS